MKKQYKYPLGEYLSIKENFMEIIIVAIILAFGVSIIVGSITLIEGYNFKLGILLGIVLCLLALIYLIIKKFSKLRIDKTFKGFIYYNIDSKEIINIPRYRYSEKLIDSLMPGFKENPALKKMWNKDCLNDCIKLNKDTNKFFLTKTKSGQLLCEATEYLILDELSTHLTDYFNKGSFDNKMLRKFKRNELPEVLLSNKFLELFSKSIDERDCFIGEDSDNKTVAMYSNGFIFKEFRLVLPKNSSVNRNDKNEIQIKTNRFKMNIGVEFNGIGTVLPTGFEEYYILEDELHNCRSLEVRVNIDIKLRLLYLFTIRKWEYYNWIDSFIEELDLIISKDKFLESIDWESALTVIQVIENREKNIKQKLKRENENKVG